MKENHNQENTMGAFHYLIYQTIKESDSNLSFFDFIQKLEKLQKTHTIKSSVCSVKNRRVKAILSYSKKRRFDQWNKKNYN